MNVSEIIKLIDAGYTKADIEKMNQPEKPAEPKADAAADPAPAAPSPEAGTEQPDAAAVNAAMLQELKDLKKAVYAMNIMNSEQPAQKSVDDILAKSLK